MSIEAELVIEQMKEHHHRDLCRLRLELEDKVCPSYQSCSLISLRFDKVLHVGHSQFFFSHRTNSTVCMFPLVSYQLLGNPLP